MQNGLIQMADAHLDDGGWEWHYDDTSDATKAILTRVVWVSGSTEINIPEHLFGTIDIKTIGTNCFNDVEGHKITKVLSMPSTITNINVNGFRDCILLTSVVIGSGVTSIGTGAFWYTGLTSVNIPDNVLTIGIASFEGSAITSVTIGSGLTTIPNDAFFYCIHLTSVNIPNNIITIGTHVFSQCTAMTSVVIGSGVLSIGLGAFYWCTNLTSVVIGNSVTTIGDQVFWDCWALESITFLGLIAPTSVGADWILNTPVSIRGHAYAASNFPAPGANFNGLTMGWSISWWPFPSEKGDDAVQFETPKASEKGDDAVAFETPKAGARF